jgi:hypothetical protein
MAEGGTLGRGERKGEPATKREDRWRREEEHVGGIKLFDLYIKH